MKIAKPILLMLAISFTSQCFAQEWVDFGQVDMSFAGTRDHLMRVQCIPYMELRDPRPALDDVPGLPVWPEPTKMVVCRYTHVQGEPQYHPAVTGHWKYRATDGLQHDVRTPIFISRDPEPLSFELVLLGSGGRILAGAHFDTLVYLHEANRGDRILMCFKRNCADLELPE